MCLNLYLFPRLRRVLKFALENATDDVLTSMDATQLREFIIDARGPIHLSPCVTTPKTNRFLPFTSPSTSSTPKMGHIRSSGASGELTKYLGPIDVIDNQRSFDSVFGTKPVMLNVSKRLAGACAIEDTKYLENNVTNYCDLYQLHLLLTSLRSNISALKLTKPIVYYMTFTLPFRN